MNEATRKDKLKNAYNVKGNGILNISIKDVDTTTRTVVGIGNTYNYFDNDMDILLPGCAAKSIREHGVNSKSYKIKSLADHDMTKRDAVFTVLEERNVDGKDVLYFEKQMMNTTLGNDKLQEYLSGAIDQHSIGFLYMDASWVSPETEHGNSQVWDKLMNSVINADALKAAGYAYVVKQIKLYEISSVAFGANPLTPTLGVKGSKELFINKIMQKLSRLDSLYRTGSLTDESFIQLEIEIAQLKQMLVNLDEQCGCKGLGCSKHNTGKENKECHSDEMVVCPGCGKEVQPTDDDTCPECGEDLKGCHSDKSKKSNEQSKSSTTLRLDLIAGAIKNEQPAPKKKIKNNKKGKKGKSKNV